MIDINDLRLPAANSVRDLVLLPSEVLELLDRLEAAEKERDWHAERCEDAMNECEALRAEIEELHVLIAAVKKQADAEFCLRVKKEEECTRLCAKIAEMEKQEPVAEWVDSAFDQYPHLRWREPYKAIVGAKLYTKLYALPGARGEEK